MSMPTNKLLCCPLLLLVEPKRLSLEKINKHVYIRAVLKYSFSSDPQREESTIMARQPKTPAPDPLEQVMETMLTGFKHTTQAIQDLRQQQAELEQRQKQQAKAAYHGMTGSGKSRYVAQLVEIEKEREERGAQARVAETLDLSPGRITQLLNSDKNRKNGK